jgi:hypothetical protein
MLRRRPPPGVHPDAILGLIDAVLTLAVTLANEGLLSREALAAAFDETTRQQQLGQCSGARTSPVRAIGEFFRLPLAGEQARARFQVIAGGEAAPDR